ncbi:MAG: hypothetical protein M3123_05600 [Actinomycetota bacterium]|nr:hypothetical protein [Actinomycetota bacterium]
MDRVNWDRWAPASGIVSALLFIAGFAITGIDAPGLGETAIDVASFFEDNRRRVLIAAVLFGLSTVSLLWFLGSLSAVMRDRDEARLAGTALASGALVAAIFLLIIAIYAGLAVTTRDAADAGAVEILLDVTWAAGVLLAFPLATLVAAAAIAAFRGRFLPGWFAWASLAAALVILAGGTTWAEDGVWAPDGLYSYVVLVGFLVWLLATSVLLVWWRVDAVEAGTQRDTETTEVPER